VRYPIPLGLAILLLVSRSDLRAQAPPDSGNRLRITSPQVPRGRTVGTLDRVTPDSIVLAGLTISRSSISRLEVSAGRRSQWPIGLGLGAGGGALLGAVTGTLLCLSPNDGEDDHDAAASCALELGGLGAVAGLIVGGIIGGLTHRDRWRSITLTNLRVVSQLRSNGTLGVSLGLRF
jgi:hypothetical protein